jgi:CMP-N-acetylneuraminic acid synthetase
MSIVGIIPARGGSRAVAKKSIAPCAGRPLLAYTCEAALGSRRLDRVLLSTDDEDIAAVGRECGIEAPFRRPSELAGDETPMVAVLQHAMSWLDAQGNYPRVLVLLQPTSPLRRAHHIDEAIDLFQASGADSVVSVTEIPHQYSPASALRMVDGRLVPYQEGQRLVLRRQDKPRAYARNGPAVLVVARDVVEQGKLYGPETRGYLMPREASIDIDDTFDLAEAECLLRASATPQAPRG